MVGAEPGLVSARAHNVPEVHRDVVRPGAGEFSTIVNACPCRRRIIDVHEGGVSDVIERDTRELNKLNIVGRVGIQADGVLRIGCAASNSR